jgi:hypothetical protein
MADRQTLPAHAFNIKYSEEIELEVRYGGIYSEYKRRVPFLIPGFAPTRKWLKHFRFAYSAFAAMYLSAPKTLFYR